MYNLTILSNFIMELKNVTEDNMSVLYKLIITVPNSTTITFIIFRRKFKIHGEYSLPQEGQKTTKHKSAK